jgi:8-oxo-dGTP pyrophosphatase MutT (NUDIX family)
MSGLGEIYRRFTRQSARRRVVAAVPVRPRAAGGLEFLLVRTSDGQRWTLPKGGCERGESLAEAAAREAAEEAGAAGRREEAKQHLVDAANAYQRAISLQDPKPPPQVEGLCRAGLANAAYYLDDYPTAAREWAAAMPLVTQADAKAWMLYRVGLCQQRLGSFEAADQTFAQVRSQYPAAAGGEPARRAATRAGLRGFYVQVGTFTSPVNADRAIAALHKGRVPAARGTDPATGRQIVRAGPVPSYPEAKALKQYLAGQYPDAVVVP